MSTMHVYESDEVEAGPQTEFEKLGITDEQRVFIQKAIGLEVREVQSKYDKILDDVTHSHNVKQDEIEKSMKEIVKGQKKMEKELSTLRKERDDVCVEREALIKKNDELKKDNGVLRDSWRARTAVADGMAKAEFMQQLKDSEAKYEAMKQQYETHVHEVRDRDIEINEKAIEMAQLQDQVQSLESEVGELQDRIVLAKQDEDDIAGASTNYRGHYRMESDEEPKPAKTLADEFKFIGQNPFSTSAPGSEATSPSKSPAKFSVPTGEFGFSFGALRSPTSPTMFTAGPVFGANAPGAPLAPASASAGKDGKFTTRQTHLENSAASLSEETFANRSFSVAASAAFSTAAATPIAASPLVTTFTSAATQTVGTEKSSGTQTPVEAVSPAETQTVGAEKSFGTQTTEASTKDQGTDPDRVHGTSPAGTQTEGSELALGPEYCDASTQDDAPVQAGKSHLPPILPLLRRTIANNASLVVLGLPASAAAAAAARTIASAPRAFALATPAAATTLLRLVLALWAALLSALAFAAASVLRPRTRAQRVAGSLFWAAAAAASFHALVRAEHAAFVPALANRACASAVSPFGLLGSGLGGGSGIPSLATSCRSLVRHAAADYIFRTGVVTGGLGLGVEKVGMGVCAPYVAAALV